MLCVTEAAAPPPHCRERFGKGSDCTADVPATHPSLLAPHQPLSLVQQHPSLTAGQWDVKAQTRYQSKRLSSRELLLEESKLTLCTKLSLSVLKAESVNLLDSSQVSEDHQTEIHVSYKYIVVSWVEANLEWVKGGEEGRRHLTFPVLQTTVLTSRNKSLDLFNSLIWVMTHQRECWLARG